MIKFYFFFILFIRGTLNANEPNKESSKLMQTTFEIRSNGHCRLFYSNYNSNTMYCGKDPTSNSSNICYGDSGGPMMYLKNNKWYLYGVASFMLIRNDVNCDSTVPSYWAKVPSYLNWISKELTIKFLREIIEEIYLSLNIK